MLFYAGINNHQWTSSNDHPFIDVFSRIIDDASDLTIGWNYCLLWQDKKVFLSGKKRVIDPIQLTVTAKQSPAGFICATAGKNRITLLSTDHQLWQYHVYEDRWTKIDNFVFSKEEYVTKIVEHRGIVALTNEGRIFNAPSLVDVPEHIKFIDVACGFEHTIMLADCGNVYSMGIGSRGQLGHGDLEDCDEPRLIEALAGLRVVKIAAASWHNAVVTDEGDLYVWGWNTNGELGVIDEQKVHALPIVVEFTNEFGADVETHVTTVQCGNAFSLCLLADKSLWGCGSNKYGQLGQSLKQLLNTKKFVELNTDFCDKKNIIDIKCNEWSSLLKTK